MSRLGPWALLGAMSIAGCSYPTLTHGVRPDSGFSIGGGSSFIGFRADTPRSRILEYADAAGYLAAGWRGADSASAAIRATFEASFGSGTSLDLYGQVPGTLPGHTWCGAGLMALFSKPRRGAIPYAMLGWPLGPGVLSVAEGVGFVRSTAGSNRGSSTVSLTTISWQPTLKGREADIEGQFFLGLAVGRQVPECYLRTCMTPIVWLGTSFGFHPAPRGPRVD